MKNFREQSGKMDQVTIGSIGVKIMKNQGLKKSTVMSCFHEFNVELYYVYLETFLLSSFLAA